jgi:hypothetical protein
MTDWSFCLLKTPPWHEEESMPTIRAPRLATLRATIRLL